MKKFPLLLSFLSLISCVEEESQCTLVRTAEGEIEAHCPRQAPITLELGEEDATRLQEVSTCAYHPDQAVLLCDELVFDLQGKRVEDSTSPPQEDMSSSSPGDREEDMFEEPLVQGVQTPSRSFARSSCTILGEEMVCQDGARASNENLEDGSTCQSTMLPGYGRRIVCRPPDEDGEPVVLLPKGEEAQPECSTYEEVVTCSDQSTQLLEELRGENGTQVTSCPSPRLVQDAPESLVASCLEELEACPECTPSSTCQRALQPGWVCDEDMVPLERREGEVCYAPGGVYLLTTLDEMRALRFKQCEEIVGDVVVQAAPDTTLVWPLALEGVRILEGSLIVNESVLSAQQVIEWDQAIANLELAIVGGDLALDGQRGLTYFDWPTSLHFVGGSVRFSAWKGLERFVMPSPERDSPRVLRGDLILQSLPLLEGIEIARTEASGNFMLADTPALQGCALHRAIQWAYGYAQGLVLIQPITLESEVPEPCLINP